MFFGSLLCHKGFKAILRSLAVLRGHTVLMWLAVKGALACLLLEHVVAGALAIQLLAASKAGSLRM